MLKSDLEKLNKSELITLLIESLEKINESELITLLIERLENIHEEKEEMKVGDIIILNNPIKKGVLINITKSFKLTHNMVTWLS